MRDRDPEGTREAIDLVAREPERVDADAFAESLSELTELAKEEGGEWEDLRDEATRAVKAVRDVRGSEVTA